MRFVEIGKTSDELNGNRRKPIESLLESPSSNVSKTSDDHLSIDRILSNSGLTSDGFSSSEVLLSSFQDEQSVNELEKGTLTQSYSNSHQDESHDPSTISEQNFSNPSDPTVSVDLKNQKKTLVNRNKEDTACILSNGYLNNAGKETIIPLQRDLLLNENATSKNVSLLDSQSKACPIVLEVPKISASITTANNKEICLDGLRYSANISSLCPALPPNLKTSTTVQEFDEICINECKDATFGAKIQAPGDLVLNQYVDFNGGLPDHSGIIVTDSSPPDNCCTRYKYAWIAIILTMFLIGAIAAATILIQADQSAGAVDPDSQSSANYTQRLVKRGQWSTHQIVFDDLRVYPARNVIVCHTADSFCSQPAICENRVRAIESYHLQLDFVGIGYSFLIGGDGFIYEGRGWGKYGAFCAGVNCNSVGVGFIGNYDNDKLTSTMVDAYNVLVEEGVRRGALAADYKLFAHHQVKKGATASPGLNIITAMQSWPHFTKQITQADKCA